MGEKKRRVDASNRTGGSVNVVGGPPYAGYNPLVTITKNGGITTITEEYEGIILETVIDKTASGTTIYPQERIDIL
jgi:hypothetical protein